ncbi:unnamed protein product [Spirodela intermedia]|uniref:Uncharacterized protein n=1 Tax=Spirodela intermedia TaxID=51605 RepID=A0A7I8JK68_SPIIN|nr:unnamed protein product [Spirodela intermedia]CAA6670577.1 unnamed protein product [Spirodela intermedia]
MAAQARVPSSASGGSPLSKASSPFSSLASAYKLGVELQIWTKGNTANCEMRAEHKRGNGLDVWLGRTAMVGFAAAITTEVATGRGLLENFGLTTPLPTVALAVTGLVGALTAFFIFQSASRD